MKKTINMHPSSLVINVLENNYKLNNKDTIIFTESIEKLVKRFKEDKDYTNLNILINKLIKLTNNGVNNIITKHIESSYNFLKKENAL